MTDILQLLLAAILESRIELATHLSIGVVRYANAARLGNCFKPGGNVDAVTKNIAFFDDDVANMDANAEFDPPVQRHWPIAFAHAALHYHCATYGIDDASEFDQDAVAR